MKCSHCQTENPDNRNFCRECGEKLIRICTRCGSENLPRDKYCGECGNDLKPSTAESTKSFSIDEQLEKLKAFIPKNLSEKILAQKEKIEGERKQVTVLFCDMEGFTFLSEKLGPESTYSIMDRVYEILIHKVHEYGGTINEMTGDGIMALFGAPVALEDAPQRAIRSALAIHREIARFNNSIEQERGDGVTVRMRIGIHTGPVVVGTLGNDLRVEFKAVGDTVNIASRMEGIAEPGTTYVTEEVFRHTEGMFRFEALGARTVKGKKEEVKVYRVIAPSTRRTRFDVSAERGLTPFVGRERELELLMDGFERVKSGRGQAFSITAEAGVGKSRLLYEFRKEVTNEELTFLEGKCLSFSRGMAYHPVVDILKSNFEIHVNDEDGVIRKKVKQGLAAVEILEASTLPYILELLSVTDSGIDQINLSAEAKKARILEAIRRVVIKGSVKSPLILAVEDLHWVDESSEEVLKDILDSISGSKVLVIFTYRPEFVHTWGGKSYHSQLNLNRLSNRESLNMLYHLLGTAEITKNLEEFILERTEGVPFFIEEFIKSLKDLKVVEERDRKYIAVKDLQDVSLPSTVQDVIMARIDSLPEAVKKVLQTGSVIGREFRYELMKEVAELPEKELLSHLSVLKDSELLYERGIYPQSTYVFKHALTQDAAYQSLLKSTRRKHHQKVAQVLEKSFPRVEESQPERLAYHYTEAGLADKAVLYWKRAGDLSIRRSAHAVSADHYARGLQLLKDIPASIERTERELELQTALGTALMAVKGFGAPEVKQAFLRARELCDKVGDTPQLFEILHGLWIFYLTQAELLTSQQIAEQLLVLAENLKDPASLIEAHHVLGSNYWWQGMYAQAQIHNEQTIALYDSQPGSSRVLLPGREDPGVMCRTLAAKGLCTMGYTDQAVYKINTAIESARELSHPFSTAYALLSAALIHLIRREGKPAQEWAEKAVALSEEQGFALWLAWSTALQGSALVEQGRNETGISLLRRGIDACQSTGTIIAQAHLHILLAEAYGRVNKIEEGLNALNAVCEIVERNKSTFYDAELYRVRGELLLMQTPPDGKVAEIEFRKAIEVARLQEAKSLELRATVSLSRLLKEHGKKEEAHKLLGEIYGRFTEGFETADLIEAKTCLADLT